jgi:hypothetical protein
VITGNVVPDHATVARFVVRHEAALAGLFGEVLRLCDEGGLVAPGLVAIDGTRLAGNASRGANREFGQIAREILAEHKATDEAEDQQYGDARGDELPEQLRTVEGRREFFRRAKQQRQDPGSDSGETERDPAPAEDEFGFDAELIVARVQGRERGGCATPGASSSSAAGKTPTRSLARARSGCGWRLSGWRAISTPSAAGTRPMRRIGRRGG